MQDDERKIGPTSPENEWGRVDKKSTLKFEKIIPFNANQSYR
jgi:hypothetical protein